MEKYVTWFWVVVKNQYKSKRTWLMLLLMILACVLYRNLCVSQNSELGVGIICKDSVYGKQIFDILQQEDSHFRFEEFEDEEQLLKQVKNHMLECGFIFDKEFDEAFLQDDLDKTIPWYVSEQQVHANVARETVSAALLRVYAKQEIQRDQKQIFGTEDQEQLERLLKYNADYLQGDLLFHMNTDQVLRESDTPGSAPGSRSPVWNGILAGLVLLNMLLAESELHQRESFALIYYLQRKDRLLFRMIYAVAASLPAMLSGIILSL